MHNSMEWADKMLFLMAVGHEDVPEIMEWMKDHPQLQSEHELIYELELFASSAVSVHRRLETVLIEHGVVTREDLNVNYTSDDDERPGT